MRYFLFRWWGEHESRGGWSDFAGEFTSVKRAQAAAEEDRTDECAHIVAVPADSVGRIVLQGRRCTVSGPEPWEWGAPDA